MVGAGQPLRPPALTNYVLKVHSRCDLACDHCYVYQHADRGWRKRPHAMAPRTVRASARRIAEHAATHRLSQVHVVLHGGEPLLLGAGRLREVLATLRAAIDPVTDLRLHMQSNGVLLSPAFCEVLAEFRVGVGISLDGDRAANDRHRRFASGASSHPQTLRALALLRRHRQIYAGILCTIDVEADPIRVYEALLAEEPPRIDLLLPHGTWDNPPPRPGTDPTPYATWLGRVYDRWVHDGRPVPIRLFDSLLSTAVGGPSFTEAVGLDPADVAVIETDGSWEQADSLKTAFDGAAATGLDVFRHAVDEAARHPGIAVRQLGIGGVSDTCRNCQVVHRCGGGLFAHRYRSGSGYDNPSVYCADLKEFIARMDSTPPHANGSVPATVLDELGSGYGDVSTMEYLAAAQVSITRALVAALGSATEAPVAVEGWQLLGRLDAERPAAVARVFAHPYVRAWAVRCLRGEADVGYLASLAAAAAVWAGEPLEVAVPVRDGMLHLPTFGRLLLSPDAGPTVALTTTPGGFEVRAGGTVHTVSTVDGAAVAPGWQPVRRLDGDGLTVELEDVDPYRDCYDEPVAARLDPAAVESWRRLRDGAWHSVRKYAPGHVPGLRVALRALTPLRPDGTGLQRSATSRHAFGAVGVAGVPDGDALAVLLVHEVQHLKLGAVLDLCDLVDPAAGLQLEVGWRDDPRPLEAALQGTYAHLAVADIWRSRDEGGAHFRRYQGWVRSALDSLVDTGALTAEGERFVGRMREYAESW
ncbi:FxsB family cyclophane-forming radical SAM/SPASM peptide maturase [Phytohabitans sp. ZYX-F-186]|uniref:FxsB family cyclophane-forming radical SAM/SPASM peptide maturase n=1 Tax=Phytohabitans maris TaxID=3071409 RepID=A0ABU0Z879_9ACTN|nr:FxsB family cyclophane-forming radical SAM/SPASM peptide maturase [Phytohabitans sp. ZYX-F-186]MDQ7903254.1 FxsB family cyclophane-forming radical SAM/SPASM peptide maturase [Phytohabitans sp. ZYX-F-186]